MLPLHVGRQSGKAGCCKGCGCPPEEGRTDQHPGGDLPRRHKSSAFLPGCREDPILGLSAFGYTHCSLYPRGCKLDSRPLVQDRPSPWRAKTSSSSGVPLVDLVHGSGRHITSAETTHHTMWFSLEGQGGPLGLDPLSQEWPERMWYTFLPFPLIH